MIFPRFCMDCCKWFRNGGHHHETIHGDYWLCDTCYEDRQIQNTRRGFPRDDATNVEIEAWVDKKNIDDRKRELLNISEVEYAKELGRLRARREAAQ